MIRYYHGGFGGLRVGDLVLPADTTKAPCLADYGAGVVCRRDRVYVATEYEAALMFAAMHHSDRGKVYEVEPIGELEADPDCVTAGLSWSVPSARVLRVFSVSRRERDAVRLVLGGAPL